MHYYYDKDGRFLGGNNTNELPNDAVGKTTCVPNSLKRVVPNCPKQVFDVSNDVWVDAESTGAAPVSINAKYKAKVAGYSLQKVKSALRFAKSSAKIAVLQARLAKLSA